MDRYTMYRYSIIEALKKLGNDSPLHIYYDLENNIPYFKYSYAIKHGRGVIDIAPNCRIWCDPRPLMKRDLIIVDTALRKRFPKDFVDKILHLVIRGPTLVNTDSDALADHVMEFIVSGENAFLTYFNPLDLELDVIPDKLLIALGLLEDVVGVVDRDLRILKPSDNGIYALQDRDRVVGVVLETDKGLVKVFEWPGIEPYTYVFQVLSRPCRSWFEIYRANEEYIENLVSKVRKVVDWLERSLGRKGVLAFSAGKDSVLAAYLLSEAGSNFDAIYTHIEHGDPEHVLSYVDRIETNLGIKIHRIEHRWSDVKRYLEVLGMPMRGYRWCTYVFKFYPQMKLIKELYGFDKVVSYTGSRKYETFKRSLKPATYVDVDLGVVNHSVPYKFCKLIEFLVLAYRYRITLVKDYYIGFERLSCIVCPYKSLYELRLSNKIYYEDFSYWIPYIEKVSHTMDIPLAVSMEYHIWRLGFQYQEFKTFSKMLKLRARIPIPITMRKFENEAVERMLNNVSTLFKDVNASIRGNAVELSYSNCKIVINLDDYFVSCSNPMSCRNILFVVFASLNCVSCSICVTKCDRDAVRLPFRIEPTKCVGCMKCIKTCPVAIADYLRLLASRYGSVYAYRWYLRYRREHAEEYIAKAIELEQRIYETKKSS